MKIAVASERRHLGMTSTEMVVSMLMLLSLVAILFVGASAWRKSSDRAACILNIRDVQAAVRGFQNTSGLESGSALDIQRDIVGPGKWLCRDLCCPAGGFYEEMTRIPKEGELAVSCSLGKNEAHFPLYTSDW